MSSTVIRTCGEATPLQREILLELANAKTSPLSAHSLRLEVANPGDSGPYLAFQHPEFLPPDGYAYVRTVDTKERMIKALRQIIGLDQPTNLYTAEYWLSKVTGVHIEKVEDD